MPSVTYDGRSFMLDSRRVWLVSGSIAFARIPRELWRDRIHAAKVAGLNTIETPVFWNRHEPMPGKFDFKGDKDLRHFVRLIGEAGLWCILRPGPFIGTGWEFGGLPAWIMEREGIELRSGKGPFLQACSRYLSAMADQVKSLQVTSAGKGGPIILVQNESQWTCGHDEAGKKYLGELGRYLREAGLTVPVVNANSLWQGVEGEIDCWVGESHLLPTMRQLATVRPDSPRIVIDLVVRPTSVWGEGTEEQPSPASVQRHLAEVLAGGAQYNIQPFHGGTNLEFSAGSLPGTPGRFVSTGQGDGSPLSETGCPGELFAMVRRVSTFASQFGRVLASLDSEYQPVVLDPDGGRAIQTRRRSGSGLSVIHTRGPQGGVAWVFAPDPDSGVSSDATATLLMSDGSTQTVEFGKQAVAWCLLAVNLTGKAHLDYCTFNAFAQVGEVFVCYGPAGKEGVLSINGSPIAITAPKGKMPVTLEHERITLVVCNERQIDRTYLTESAVYAGVDGVRADGSPIEPSSGKYVRISRSGEVTVLMASAVRVGRTAGKVTLSEWKSASTADYRQGDSARYAAIDGPADLTTLGAPLGYGWYRMELKFNAAKRFKLVAPQWTDRLHVWHNGEWVGLLGEGPGAADRLEIAYTKGSHTLVALADNMGRLSGGEHMDRRKGACGHLWELSPLKIGRAKLETCEPVDPFALHTPLWEVHEGDYTSPERTTWVFTHRRKTPVFLFLPPMTRERALLILNDEPIDLLDSGSTVPLCLWPEQLRAGSNVVQLAALPGTDASELFALVSRSSAFEGARKHTGKASWAFARWEQPLKTAYKPAQGGGLNGPTWWRCTFKTAGDGQPLMLDLAGMTKGQIYVNDRHIGRYFVAEASGKDVGTQQVYYVPEPFYQAGKDNTLVLFEEHAGNPSKVSLAGEKGAWPIRA
ncbi:MAG: beta-galactosidase [Planctomycetes bacterium]|nr:beta-galactosidase [Planctomycetota bacterium]